MLPDSNPSLPTLCIWHGYLLGATGSNIYTHHLVESWVRAGHDVVLSCQEPDPTRHPSIHEVVRLARDSATGSVTVASRDQIRTREAGHGRCTMVVPDIHGLLPVYVLDRYDGYEVVRVPGLEPERLAAYLGDHAAAMQWVVDEFQPAGVLINHASPLPAALAPVLDAAGVPFAVKVHGSELEYALVEDASLIGPAADALARAASVLVGSDHIERRTRELLGNEAVDDRVSTVPPGVDLDRFHPIDRDDASRARAHARLIAEVEARIELAPDGRGQDARDRTRELVTAVGHDPDAALGLIEGLRALHGSYEERQIEGTAVAAARELRPADRALIVFVGKLIPQKGVHLLLAAMPFVLEVHPTAQVVVAGFGPLRDGLEAQLVAMACQDMAAIDALADHMGALSGEGQDDLPHLRAFLDDARERGQLDAWLAAAREHQVDQHMSWLGLVDHGVLAELCPLAETSVVPSVLAEAFGMVAAEAAATGCVPIVSDHSGLADAASVIELDGVAPVRFDVGGAGAVGDITGAVRNLADALIARLSYDTAERERQAAAARANVARVWSWDALSIEVAELMTGAAARA
ncbi:MAG: glycosyl transferase group 1 [Thermoleophilia bacterium]|nr:glycosyl transferase group 1 [Thermoleophilia bacterium]